jgi:hypothetical protein
LFGVVRIQPEDAIAPLQLAGITITTTGDTAPRFTLACTAHRDGCCQVYADRPSNCRSYKCKLLTRFSNGKVTWDEAQEQMGRMRRLREQLRKEVERVRPGLGATSVVAIAKIAPSLETLKADGDLHRLWAPVMLRLVAIRRLALDTFHRPRKRGVPPGAGE